MIDDKSMVYYPSKEPRTFVSAKFNLSTHYRHDMIVWSFNHKNTHLTTLLQLWDVKFVIE